MYTPKKDEPQEQVAETSVSEDARSAIEKGIIVAFVSELWKRLCRWCTVAITISFASGVILTAVYKNNQLTTETFGPPQTTPIGQFETTTSSGSCYPYMDGWQSQYGVPKNIQYGIIRMESGGKAGASTVTRLNEDGRQLYARGCFQVVDFEGRFSPHEDPYNPHINAREGLGYLIGCNTRYTGNGNTNWNDTNVLLNTFMCYHAGPNGNWGNSKVQQYARNVLALSQRYTG